MKSTLFLLFSALLISIAFGQYTNIQIDNAGSPEEPSIAINPKNPNQVIAGANIDFYYYSTNGGSTWTNAYSLVPAAGGSDSQHTVTVTITGATLTGTMPWPD